MSKDNSEMQSKLKIISTILLPVFAMIVPIVLYMFQLKDKKLTYEVVSYSLINSSSTIQDDIEINFLGKKFTDLSALNIEIKNAGDIPILKEDFERNISIDFGKEAEILKTSIKIKDPSNLTPVVNNQGEIAQISPILLNPGDCFSLEAIVSNASLDPNFDARISGIKAATKISPKQYSGTLLPNKLLLLIICILFLYYSFFFSIVSLCITRKTLRFQKLLNYKPFVFLALLSLFSGAFLLIMYMEKNSIQLLSFETLLYFLAMGLGTFMGFKAIWKLYKKMENVNESSEIKNFQ